MTRLNQLRLANRNASSMCQKSQNMFFFLQSARISCGTLGKRCHVFRPFLLDLVVSSASEAFPISPSKPCIPLTATVILLVTVHTPNYNPVDGAFVLCNKLWMPSAADIAARLGSDCPLRPFLGNKASCISWTSNARAGLQRLGRLSSLSTLKPGS